MNKIKKYIFLMHFMLIFAVPIMAFKIIVVPNFLCAPRNQKSAHTYDYSI